MRIDVQRLTVAVVLVLVIDGIIALSLQPKTKTTGADPADSVAVMRGRQLYVVHCASCHGQNLEGEPGWRATFAAGGRPAPPHDARGHTWHHHDLSLFTMVKFGGQATARVGATKKMSAFSGVLSDEEIYAVLAYIKST